MELLYCNLTDESKVSCSLCLQEVPRGGKDVKSFNTSNMRCHLKYGTQMSSHNYKQKRKTKKARVVAQVYVTEQVINQQ